LVFRGVSFALKPGDALVLRGRNGSGKSSLLRVLAGLLRPAAGEVLWRGAPITGATADHRERLGYVGHLDAVKGALTVREDLSFWAGLRGFRGGTAAERVPAALAALDLAGLADTPGRLLSAGQRRRLALARLLVAPAELWLLDEPAVTLDAASVRLLGRMIAAHRAGGGIVALSAHGEIDIGQARTLDLDAAADEGSGAAEEPLGALAAEDLSVDGWSADRDDAVALATGRATS
jgi:heme exporter protein A